MRYVVVILGSLTIVLAAEYFDWSRGSAHLASFVLGMVAGGWE